MLNAQGLLQDRLSAIRLLGDQKGQHTLQSVTVADYLEYVDARTGFTPLLAAIFYHNIEAAKLVSCKSNCASNQVSKSFLTAPNWLNCTHVILEFTTQKKKENAAPTLSLQSSLSCCCVHYDMNLIAVAGEWRRCA